MKKPREFWIDQKHGPFGNDHVINQPPEKGFEYYIHVIEFSAFQKLQEEFKEIFMDFLNQGCGIYNREKDIMEYDHCCLSTYEHGVQRALDEGWITKEQVLR